MTLPPPIFTLDIAGKPILAFEAKNLRESQQLCHERWLRQDIADLMSNGVSLWDGKARLRVRRSTEREIAMYREAARDAAQPQGDLLLAYLVELDDLREKSGRA
ncbi:hypothetical protein [Bradyrhizobium archetypum]|jgi:hypothetical protein|uniref:Uncharacterized protein n=1 Tax=Bradyrhizobium archetypum TaxID=2721160 RepID=A0A7Y4H1W5_9BRAD|nr:hypothetical protein [Bradyrhizobium archetypum]NOJ45802.1 hypothetical protein [Bradyrhizobium archetypum]